MTTAKGGRPRDPRVDEALTEHLVELLAQRGPDGFTVDELASRCGVGKAAIYRRYRCREELIEAGFAAVNESMPDVTGLPFRAALVELLDWLSSAHATGMTPTWLLGMQNMPQLKDLYRARVVGPRREAIAAVVERGRHEGLIRGDVDPEVVMTALAAPAILIGMHRASGSATGEVSIDEVVDLLLSGLSPAVRANGS